MLLVLIGAAVSEVALWGRRQQGTASARAGYLQGVLEAAETISLRHEPAEKLMESVAQQIADVLGVACCRFVAGPVHDPRYAVLERDGSVTRRGHALDVDRDGLPTDEETVLLVRSGTTTLGDFIVTAAGVSRAPQRSNAGSPSSSPTRAARCSAAREVAQPQTARAPASPVSTVRDEDDHGRGDHSTGITLSSAAPRPPARTRRRWTRPDRTLIVQAATRTMTVKTIISSDRQLAALLVGADQLLELRASLDEGVAAEPRHPDRAERDDREDDRRPRVR